ncbi:hypothetical protein AX16_000579 [Volvariella volvacea WC 439]|nr:hypothetical protein AX16_000579 [Volvariella volvacea WC 439]
MTDLLVYSIIIPVMPFQLERLGYSNVSSLAGWLLFAYSGGLALMTIPIAQFSERYGARRTPLIVGLVILLGSQIMLMEAPNYAVMCVARALQGVGSSMVWVVGLALLCDSTPEQVIGRQLGIAMSGLSIGVVMGPPIGGALYDRFGFRGPFIFGLIVTSIDLIGRLLVIERSDALKWGVDPAAPNTSKSSEAEKAESGAVQSDEKEQTLAAPSTQAHAETIVPTPSRESPVPNRPQTLSLVAVLVKLARSPRANIANICTFTYGVVYSSQEPTIPVHLNRIWGLDPGKVGLVFLAAVVPTMFSSPITGYLSDKYGTEWITVASILLALPWWGLVIIEHSLALFIAAFALENFFTASVLSPLTAELAAVARDIEGIGYAHVYAAFNLAYGIGSAVGPVVGGQMFDNLDRGWMAQCLLAIGLLAGSAVLGFFFIGPDPLWHRLLRSLNMSKSGNAVTPTPIGETALNPDPSSSRRSSSGSSPGPRDEGVTTKNVGYGANVGDRGPTSGTGNPTHIASTAATGPTNSPDADVGPSKSVPTPLPSDDDKADQVHPSVGDDQISH